MKIIRVMETGPFPNISLLICEDTIKITDMSRPRGLMEKASDFGSGDTRFESWRGRDFFLFFLFFFRLLS